MESVPAADEASHGDHVALMVKGHGGGIVRARGVLQDRLSGSRRPNLLLPAATADVAFAPKVLTGVVEVVLDGLASGTAGPRAVNGAGVGQCVTRRWRRTTDGPPAGLKSVVTFNVMVPDPPDFVVRIL